MKTILNSIFALGAAALMAVSCNVENVGTLYDFAEFSPGVSFLLNQVSDTEISATQANYIITVARRDKVGAVRASLSSTLPAEIGVPTSVTFADGEATAEISIDLSAMVIGTSYKGDITIKSNTDDLARTTLPCTFQKAYSFLPYGTAKITDDLIADVFGTENVTWSVEAQKAEGLDVFRLIDPYGPNFPYNEPGDYKLGAKWIIDCTNPNAVNFDETLLGFDWGYGEFKVSVLEPGSFKGNVITFPVNGLKFTLPDYGWFYGNPNGAFKIDLNQ